ncbi:hypothetical protein SBRY_60005 [Actinacidiphila bryophytorum]|uniref:Uncharacterized protein n=1 Tax=Actinacidiphila bryophytorum TaxID=1436133 RepID=A0A9W4H5P5_9ACTN|nr:hypothetical protein SBRY_60005 [Actinacidiphila bryophytorum]
MRCHWTVVRPRHLVKNGADRMARAQDVWGLCHPATPFASRSADLVTAADRLPGSCCGYWVVMLSRR